MINPAIEGSYGDHPAPPALSDLADKVPVLALTRYQIIRSFLEDGIPLARIPWLIASEIVALPLRGLASGFGSPDACGSKAP